MKYDIDETVAAALMSGEPVILVEGIDDIKFYGNIAEKCNLMINVHAIETIEGYGEGCTEVLRAIEDIQDKIARDDRLQKYVLGIIDRDARYYRGELPNLKCIFVLKYYSYESHLITNVTIKKQIQMMTRVNNSMINDNIINYLLREFDKKLDRAYYIALEALKNSCVPDYKGCVSYSCKAGNIFDRGAFNYIWSKIELKKVELEQFAYEYGITRNDIKYILKGKWWLHLWCELIVEQAKTFHLRCGNVFTECQMCKSGKKDKCLWKQEGNFQMGQLKSFLCSIDAIDLEEIRYVYERLKLLAS